MENIKNFFGVISRVVGFAVVLPFVFVGAFFASAVLLVTLPVIPMAVFFLLFLASVSKKNRLESEFVYSCNLIYFEDLEMNVIDIRSLVREDSLNNDICMTG